MCFYLYNLLLQDPTLYSRAYLSLVLVLCTTNVTEMHGIYGYVVLCLGSIFSKLCSQMIMLE